MASAKSIASPSASAAPAASLNDRRQRIDVDHDYPVTISITNIHFIRHALLVGLNATVEVDRMHGAVGRCSRIDTAPEWVRELCDELRPTRASGTTWDQRSFAEALMLLDGIEQEALGIDLAPPRPASQPSSSISSIK